MSPDFRKFFVLSTHLLALLFGIIDGVVFVAAFEISSIRFVIFGLLRVRGSLRFI